MTALALYDSTEAARVPPYAQAVAGYLNGEWPSFEPLRARFPRARAVSITVRSDTPGMVLDVENGDATPTEAAAWARWQRDRGVALPALYCALDTVPALEVALRAQQLQRREVRLWTAHWTGKPHICDRSCAPFITERPGATQWRSLAARGYDQSLTTTGWVDAVIRDYARSRQP